MIKYKVCCLDTVERYKSNILYYSSFSDTHKKTGLVWYKKANKLCKDIARKTGLQVNTIAGIISVLSPNQNWQVQQKFTERFIQDIQSGAHYTKTGYGYYTNRLKAVNMILSNSVYPYLRGAKVEAFYNNIIGNYDFITLDLWAIRIACNNLNMNKAEVSLFMREGANRDMVLHAYRLAATEANYQPAVMQSLCWDIVRSNLKQFKNQ